MTQKKSEGRLYIVAGPSGIGKGTICKRLFAQYPRLENSISWTTRELRPGEIADQTYFFRTQEAFDRMAREGGFLEYAQIYGGSYGTPRDYVLSRMAQGKDVMLDIETKGAMQVMKNYPEAVSIYLLPPTMKALRDRLFRRGREDEQKAQARFACAVDEIDLAAQYRYVVINDDLESTLCIMHEIMEGRYHNPENWRQHIENLKEEYHHDY